MAPDTPPHLVPYYAPALAPLPGGTLSPNTPPHLVPVLAPNMAPLPGGTLSPNTPPHMVPLFMPALMPQYLPPPNVVMTFRPDTPPVHMPALMPAMMPAFLPPGATTFSPATPPAILPMLAPAMVPGLPGETLSPNTPPAMIPILMPAMVPGPGETFAPNTSPALIPMMMPAIIPGPGETFAPNIMPAMIPVMVPAMVPPGTTLSPATMPAMMPLLMPATLPANCFTDNGLYASATGQPETISWTYGVTVKSATTTADEVQTQLLPALEIAMADALVPILFDVPGCGVDNDGNSRERRLQQAGTAIMGLSSRPDDVIDPSITECGPTPCFGINGTITLFTMRRRGRRALQGNDEPPAPLSANQVMVLSSLQDIIESGRFDNFMMGDIVGVTYLGPFVNGTNDGVESDESGKGMSSSTLKAVIGGAVGGITALLILAIGCFVIARNRQRDRLGNFPVSGGNGGGGHGGEGESNIIPDIEEPDDMASPTSTLGGFGSSTGVGGGGGGGGGSSGDHEADFMTTDSAEDYTPPPQRSDSGRGDAPGAQGGMLA
jgi:hypothetical protein